MGLITELVESEKKRKAEYARAWLRSNLRWQFTGHNYEGRAFPPDEKDTWYVWAREHAEEEMKTDDGALALLARIQKR